ncbi:PspC domain-containing protein [Haloactinopolyspora sp.]|jgi:phage shock protein PspC (stress-responsive transcriptional regulator)|uniref:PspC domain-containing protein n=1 Tax=Haloactinopolyspora sp. TaxID=1966353 RepID=UPI0026037FEB|nr:PspC domain-containing protein [Haloactinopolyspora sp.]
MTTSYYPTKRRSLSRPRDGRVIGGVCAGLARRFGITPTTMRVIAIASCLLPGPQVLAYVALWVIMPEDD